MIGEKERHVKVEEKGFSNNHKIPPNSTFVCAMSLFTFLCLTLVLSHAFFFQEKKFIPSPLSTVVW